MIRIEDKINVRQLPSFKCDNCLVQFTGAAPITVLRTWDLHKLFFCSIQCSDSQIGERK